MDQPSQATTPPATPSAVAAEITRCGVICVDLDGTLTRSDAFGDALVMHMGRGPRGWAQVARWLGAGRASAKAQIHADTPFDASLPPYNESLIAWLQGWKAKGVRIVLATAADAAVARAVAAHLGLFDDVIASDGTINLKSAAKAAAMTEAYGEKGFVYAGDSAADLKVWPHAAAAVAVNASPRVRATLADSDTPAMILDPQEPQRIARAFLKAIRPHQWSKNALIFVPILTAGDIGNAQVWLWALLAFIAFSLTASGVYLINDALDLNSDRRHPRKRNRPFASGALPIGYAAAALPIFLLGLGFAIVAGIFTVILAYIALTTFYSFYGKRKVILDVVLLAVLYTIRLYAGGIATGHIVSDWLLGFSGFLFFNLAVMKRYAELYSVDEASLSGRGYAKSDLPFLLSAGMASGFSACVVLALYVEDNLVRDTYSDPALLWALAPLMLVWQLRLWRETTQGRMHDDPIIFAARDRATLMIGACVGAAVLIAHANPF